VTREFVRRSCGHAETVYVVGPFCGRHKRIHAKELEVCGACRKRERIPDSSDPVIVTAGETDRKASEDPDLRGEIRDILKERKQFHTNKGDSA